MCICVYSKYYTRPVKFSEFGTTHIVRTERGAVLWRFAVGVQHARLDLDAYVASYPVFFSSSLITLRSTFSKPLS